MRHIAVITLFLVAGTLSGQTRSPEIRPRFEGNARVSSEELLLALRAQALLAFRPGVEGRIGAAVRAAYRDRGFLLVETDSVRVFCGSDSAWCEASISLREGPLVRIGQVAFAGCDSLPEMDVVRDMALAPGSPFSESLLRAATARLLAALEAASYPFATVLIDTLGIHGDRDEGTADLLVRVEAGQRFLVSEVSIQGNTATDAGVILRELRLGKDEPFDPVKVNDLRRRLERLNFFSSVSDPELYIRNGRSGIAIRVTEANTNVFDGIVGYQPPRAGEDAGYLTGLVNLSFRNLFGSGRRFDARWERATRATTELELRALEPWIFGFPLNLQGGFFQRQQDSTYVRRSFDGRATLLASSALNLSAGIQGVRVIPAFHSVLAALPSSSTLSGSLELAIDTRDTPFNPHAGVQLRNSYAGGSKTFTRPGAADSEHDAVQRIEIDAAWFGELYARSILALAVHGRELRGGALDASDLYRLGGAATLRGYREEQFSGTRLAWGSIEYRYSLGPRSFAFAFFDFGYIYSAPGQNPARDEFTATRAGYGIGGRLETGLGVLGVSYALGQGDSFSTGKIHFGLINEF